MTIQRRSLGTVSLSLFGAVLGAGPGHAQAAWPDRPVTMVVPYPAGGSTDAVARILAQRLSADLGKAFVVENRAGAAGTIAANYVARARPDGYTLFFVPAGVFAMAPHLYQVPYDNAQAFAGVGLMASMPMFLVVPKNSPARTLAEFVELAKRDKGISYANPGSGSSTHLATELFLQAAGINMADVGYRGGAPALQAVMTNEAQMVVLAASGVLPQMQSGDVRALAVLSPDRSPFAPEVPTVAESGYPGFEAVEEISLVAPVGTPEALLRRINAAARTALEVNEVRGRLAPLAVAPTVGEVEAWPAYFVSENNRWREVIRTRNIVVQ